MKVFEPPALPENTTPHNTEESLLEVSEKFENRTDNTIKESRSEADHRTSSSRSAADTLRENQRNKFGGDLKSERDFIDQLLIGERRETDQATSKQQSHTDSAISQEREIKNSLMCEFLEEEKGQSDTEALHASHVLFDEVSAHSKTKVSLTTRDEFLAIVSHDLRNPIGAASSCAEMLLSNNEFELSSKIIPWIELIKRNTDTALRVISDLLDVERIAENKLELNFEVHNIDKVIREVIESFTFIASAKNVLLRFTPSNIITEVVFDCDRITQVLSNLISNALKFTPEGKSIKIGAVQTESVIQVFVQDTGPGIPDEKLNYIFDRFAQLGSKDRSGLGLGLYIAKMLIEAHHGQLWVDSKVGDGSTFYFTIPSQELSNEAVH